MCTKSVQKGRKMSQKWGRGVMVQVDGRKEQVNTHFQMLGGRLVHRRYILDILVKGWTLLGGCLPTFYINWIFKNRHTSTGILVNYPEASLGGYLPTFYINWIFKNRQKPQTHKHRHLGGLPRRLLGWLPTYILYKLDFQKQSKAADTEAQAFWWITQRALWVATYLHFIVTGFSKTAKSRRHTCTGI